MKNMKRLFSMLMVVCMIFSLCATVSYAADYDLVLDTPTLETKVDGGNVRKNATISGTFEGVGSGQQVVVALYFGGDMIASTMATTEADGTFEKVFAIPDNDLYCGTYTVKVNAYLANELKSTTFTMTRVGTNADLLTVSAKGVAGTITEGLSPVASVTVPGTTDLSALALTFTVSPGATAKVGTTTLVSGETELDFTNPQTITVISETEQTTKTYLVGVQKEADSTPDEGSTITSGNDNTGSIVVVTPVPTPDPVVEPDEPEIEVNFTDLGSVSWAEEAIINLAKKGVISGRSDSIFDPNGLVTREEYAKLLVLAFDLKAENATCDFGDVSEDDWYYEYVAIASSCGVVNGMGNGNFGVGSTITRQDMAVMTYRAAMARGKALQLVAEPIAFADAGDIAAYAIEAVNVMQRAGIINGMGDNRFEPNGTATRAQAAKIIDMVTR